jgi:CyaY protein
MALMDPQEFRRLSDACLDKVIDWADTFDPDVLDYSTADGVVTLEFADRQRYVLNRQSGNHQMWFAAGVRAVHYDWDGEQQRWLDARGGPDLYEQIAEVVSAKLGRKVNLS